MEFWYVLHLCGVLPRDMTKAQHISQVLTSLLPRLMHIHQCLPSTTSQDKDCFAIVLDCVLGPPLLPSGWGHHSLPRPPESIVPALEQFSLHRVQELEPWVFVETDYHSISVHQTRVMGCSMQTFCSGVTFKCHHSYITLLVTNVQGPVWRKT